MRDITTRTTVPVTTPLRPPRAGKGKPAEEKTAPPASSSRSDKRYVRSYGRSARRDQRAVCSPSLPARLPASSSPAAASHTDRLLRKHLEYKPRQTRSPALSSRAGGGAFFLPPSLFSFSAFLYFFLVLLLFSFPLLLFSLTKAHEGAHPALPGKTGRAGCVAAVRQLPWPREEPPRPLTAGAIQL